MAPRCDVRKSQSILRKPFQISSNVSIAGKIHNLFLDSLFDVYTKRCMQITGTFSFMRNEVKPLNKYANLHFIELFLHMRFRWSAATCAGISTTYRKIIVSCRRGAAVTIERHRTRVVVTCSNGLTLDEIQEITILYNSSGVCKKNAHIHAEERRIIKMHHMVSQVHVHIRVCARIVDKSIHIEAYMRRQRRDIKTSMYNVQIL